MKLSDAASIAASEFSPIKLFEIYTSNLVWNLFLTSTACHAILLITSPLQAVIKWYRRQSSDTDTPIPYICSIIGTLLWLRYAIFIEDLKLILLQSYAAIMQSFFIITMIIYRSRKKRLIRVALIVVVIMSLLFFYVHHLSSEDGKVFVGRLASGAQIAGSLVCPYLIYRAVTSKCIDFVPFAPVAFTWVMEIHAIGYSIGINDFYMLLANTVFCCMDGSLLLMFFIYPSEKPENLFAGKEDINIASATTSALSCSYHPTRTLTNAIATFLSSKKLD